VHKQKFMENEKRHPSRSGRIKKARKNGVHGNRESSIQKKVWKIWDFAVATNRVEVWSIWISINLVLHVILGPVHPTYNPSFLACFFQPKQYFSLTRNQLTVFFSRLISTAERGLSWVGVLLKLEFDIFGLVST
jgi:hypothetical protein